MRKPIHLRTLNAHHAPLWVRLYAPPCENPWAAMIVSDEVPPPGPSALSGLPFFGATPEDLCGRPRPTRDCRTRGSHHVDDVRYVSGPPADPRTVQPQSCPWWHPDWPLATGAIHTASPDVPTCSPRQFLPTCLRRICLDTMGQSPRLSGDAPMLAPGARPAPSTPGGTIAVARPTLRWASSPRRAAAPNPARAPAVLVFVGAPHSSSTLLSSARVRRHHRAHRAGHHVAMRRATR